MDNYNFTGITHMTDYKLAAVPKQDHIHASEKVIQQEIHLDEQQTKVLTEASALIAAHQNTGRSNPLFFILKFVYGNLSDGGWCRSSLRSIGLCMKRTGYSKNLGADHVGRLTKRLLDAGLLSRERRPKNDRYTYDGTSLGAWLYWWKVKRNKGKYKIILHNSHELPDTEKQKMSGPNQENVGSNTIICERENMKENLRGSISCSMMTEEELRRLESDIADLGFSRGTAKYWQGRIDELGIRFDVVQKAIGIYYRELCRGNVQYKTSYFGKILMSLHDADMIEQREIKARLMKGQEIEASLTTSIAAQLAGKMSASPSGTYKIDPNTGVRDFTDYGDGND